MSTQHACLQSSEPTGQHLPLLTQLQLSRGAHARVAAHQWLLELVPHLWAAVHRLEPAQRPHMAHRTGLAAELSGRLRRGVHGTAQLLSMAACSWPCAVPGSCDGGACMEGLPCCSAVTLTVSTARAVQSLQVYESCNAHAACSSGQLCSLCEPDTNHPSIPAGSGTALSTVGREHTRQAQPFPVLPGTCMRPNMCARLHL